MKMLCYKNGDVYLDKYSILNALDNTLGLSLNLEEIDTYLEDLASNKIIIEDSKRKFYALMPNFELEDVDLSDDEAIYFIFEMVEKNDKEELVEVEDEDLLSELSEQFEERLKDH